MVTARCGFNIYLLCLAVALAGGCKSPEEKKEKQFSTLRLHMQVTPGSMDFSTPVEIYREKPVTVNVDRDAFLTEADVAEASIVEVPGGWSLQIKFERRGVWLLEQRTTANPGKHIAIFSEFGAKPKQARWLGAPAMPKRISNGILTFTPDATREEVEEIVLGLNNLARKLAKKSKW